MDKVDSQTEVLIIQESSFLVQKLANLCYFLGIGFGQIMSIF